MCPWWDYVALENREAARISGSCGSHRFVGSPCRLCAKWRRREQARRGQGDREGVLRGWCRSSRVRFSRFHRARTRSRRRSVGRVAIHSAPEIIAVPDDPYIAIRRPHRRLRAYWSRLFRPHCRARRSLPLQHHVDVAEHFTPYARARRAAETSVRGWPVLSRPGAAGHAGESSSG